MSDLVGTLMTGNLVTRAQMFKGYDILSLRLIDALSYILSMF